MKRGLGGEEKLMVEEMCNKGGGDGVRSERVKSQRERVDQRGSFDPAAKV